METSSFYEVPNAVRNEVELYSVEILLKRVTLFTVFTHSSKNMIPPYAVYILKCKDGSYYTGFSSNIYNRVKADKAGEVKYTKSRLPVELIHISFFKEKQKAYDFERYLKTGSGIAFRNKRLV